MDAQFCWEPSENGCICGHDCDPPRWLTQIWDAEEGKQKAEAE
ncbi:hypothetical protein SEA_CHRIDISON_56 [Arthrobacter phage Chridison]|nr:hypothetical protein SEA_ALEDEL_59 [Arthrobacter phage Aledel]WAB09109.1 hypothetical protein SEA_CHRIDISON_56 [Arthrobacter phage Chridison]